MIETKALEKYFFFGLLLTVIIFTIFIFRPFLSVLVLGASLSVILYPIYRWLKHKVTRGIEWLASLITVILFIIILCGPLFLIGVLVFHQVNSLYHSITDGGTSIFINRIADSINQILPAGIQFDARAKAVEILATVSQNISQIFTTTLSTLFSLLLIFLSIFYFLKDGKKWREALILLSPLSHGDDQKILTKLRDAVNGVIKGYLIIGVVQGTLMGIGLAIFGVPSPALWGLLTAVASLIPTVGTALISVPAILYLFAIGNTPSAIGLMIWSGVIVGTVDNFLNPVVIGKQTNVPPLLILFSVLGGVVLMGAIGILVGPLTLSFLYVLVSLYREREEAASGISQPPTPSVES